MSKVLLVEDDNNLREIYQARLTAEGYDIVTAQNGEEALVVAKQNKPDLVISDVMMPRISGFEMLDILRNTDGIKHTRVIMLTALGQADDQKRAESLGADRYLVKSQVTLEDIVNAAKELLTEDGSLPPVEAAPAPVVAPAVPAPVMPTIVDAPVQPVPEPVLPPPAVPVMSAVPPPPVPVPPSALSPVTPVIPVTVPTPTPMSPAPGVQTAPVVASGVPIPTPVPVSETVAAPAPVPVPVPATVVAEPNPSEAVQTPSGPTTPAVPPSASSVDNAAQGLEAEEAALQAQIASYGKSTTVAPVAKESEQAPAEVNSNDQAIAEAVNKLNVSAEVPTPVAPPSANTAVTSSTSPAGSNASSEPVPAPAPMSASGKLGDSATIAGKKIISPISSPAQKPDLDALLAKEEAKNGVDTVATPVVNGNPARTPVQPPAGGVPGQAFDPNTSL